MSDQSDQEKNIPDESCLTAYQVLEKRLVSRESDGRVFLAGESLGAQDLAGITELQHHLLGQGVTLLVINGATTPGSRGHFYDTIQGYLAGLEARRQLCEKSQALFEFLNVSFRESSQQKASGSWHEMYRDALSRLWVSLASNNRLSLLILNTAQLGELDRGPIQHLMRYFYTDPIGTLLPESEAWDRARGSIVLAGSGCEALVSDGIEYEVLSLANESEQAVRRFLAREDVVQRFVRSIGGDPERLDELVSVIPDGVEQFWMHRFKRLAMAEQHLVEILACARGWLGADRLHHACVQLGMAEHFSRHLNALIQVGFITRNVGSGQVLLALEHRDFAEHLYLQLSDERREAVHLALAEAELGCDLQSPCVEALARHFQAANRTVEGVQYGLLAARQYVQRCEFEAAVSVLEPLLKLDCGVEQVREIHGQLAAIHTRLGGYHKALLHYDYLKDDLSDASAQIEWLCKTGNLLVKIGQGAHAVQVFEQAEDLLDSAENMMLEVDVLLGKGEAFYALGDSARAGERARDVLEKVGAFESTDYGESARIDEHLIRARNLLGKIAIYEAQYSLATEYFQQNDQVAARWGWEREVARAQANLGVVQMQLRNYGEAHERLARALELSRIPGTLPRAYCLLNLGIVHQRQAHFELALSHYFESLRAARRSGDNVAYSISAHNLATLYQDMGAFERAWKVLEHLEAKTRGQAGVELDEQESPNGGQHRFVNRWAALLNGHLLLEQERYVEALDAFLEISQSAAGLSEIVYGAEAKLRLVEVNLELGNVAKAEALLEAFDLSEESIDEPQLNALVTLYRSRLLLEHGALDEALVHGTSACDDLVKLGMFRDGLQAEQVISEVLIRTNEHDRARLRLQQAIQTVRARAEQMPQEFQASFYGLGAHRQLIEQFQRVNGEVPVEFVGFESAQNHVVLADSDIQDIQNIQDIKEVAKPVRDVAFEKLRANYSNIIGESARLHQIFRFVDRVASSDTIVLLTGESGTGKELIAEALHERSRRAKKAFVRVNCAAFVESLLLSELFGHEKGAFTGAQTAKAGRFELADGGTLFLDEIGDISPNTQVALLRVLQEGTFERVGGTETRSVNVRVVCATNKNLDEMVKRGEFRLDLYYRLKGLVIELPALRERREDIPRLLNHFAVIHHQSSVVPRFSVDAMRFLCAYSWTGNIRELENFVKSVLLFVEGDTVEMSHIEDFREFFADGEVNLDLPEIAYAYEQVNAAEVSGDSMDSSEGSWLDTIDPNVDAEEALVEHIVAQGLSLTKLKKRLEVECIKRALEETEGNITRAADLLQMKRPRLSQIINSSEELMGYRAELVG